MDETINGASYKVLSELLKNKDFKIYNQNSKK